MFPIPVRREKHSDDTSTLMTDVWTFMAILGFCLAIIFALVQSLPFASQGNQPNIRELELIRLEINGLNTRLEELAHNVLKLDEQAWQIKKEVDQASALYETEQGFEDYHEERPNQESEYSAPMLLIKEQLETNKIRLTALKQAIEMAKKRLEQTREEMEQARAVPEQERAVKDDVKSRTRDAEKEQTDIARELKRLQRKLDLALNHPESTEAKLKKIMSQTAKIKESSASNETEPDKPFLRRDGDHADVERKGFTLRFQSESALAALLDNGQVRFYLVAAGKAWILENPINSPEYRPAQVNELLYEMHRDTVPDAYILAARSVVASGNPRAQSYYVTLSSQIKTQLERLSSGASGGDLIIQGDGKVRLE